MHEPNQIDNQIRLTSESDDNKIRLTAKSDCDVSKIFRKRLLCWTVQYFQDYLSRIMRKRLTRDVTRLDKLRPAQGHELARDLDFQT